MSNEQPPNSAPVRPTASQPPPSAPAAQFGNESHLFDRLSVLYKYRWASLTVFVLVVGWSMVDSYSQVPVYRATAQVLIEDPNSDVTTPTEIARNVTSSDPEVYLQTQLRIMRGRDLANRVAETLHLENVPEFNGEGPKPTPMAQGIASIKRYAAIPFRIVTQAAWPSATAGRDAAGRTATGYADILIGRLGAEEVRGSQLVDMSFDSSDPEFAARAVNAFADRYVEENLTLKIGSLEKSADWLTGEVEKQAQLVRSSELALAKYKESNDASSLDSGQNIVVTRLNQLSDALTTARTNRIQRESDWRQVEAAGENIDSVSSIINSAGVQAARIQLNTLQQDRARVSERYGDKHPEYQKVMRAVADAERQLTLEVSKSRQNTKNEFDAAIANERALQQSVNEAKASATALGRKGVDYAVLLREHESYVTIHNQLLTREKELRVVANSRTNNVRVVERAEVPGSPFTPDHRRDWTYALLVGLALALGIAFGIDYLDDTVKTPEDVTRRLKLKFLGLVPIVAGDRHPLISGPVPHDFGEAYRSIRTSLAAQLPGDGPRVVAVASSQPLEGKTTTAVNIAMALAVGGSRVLLIDADMRRPSVHKALRMTNDRGLSQLLAGQARMREVVQRTHDPNLLAITAGRTPANPSELLASDRMRALLTGLETGPFDWIIIDTPPVLAVTDAVILAPLVSAMTFVIGAEMTRWRLAERAVETLLQSNPRQVFAVLNKVNFGRNKYYYSRYYGHQYKNYYAESPAA
jgi:polysaccharide biosynthesis transport protein